MNLQWPEGLRLVEPDVLIELRRENGLEIVAQEFALRAVDDPDRPLETGWAKLVAKSPVLPLRSVQWKEKAGDAAFEA
jgi:hypothetical protein